MFRPLNFILAFTLMATISSGRVKQAPSLTDISKIKQTYVAWPANTPLSLTCKADGELPLYIRWYKNGVLLKPSTNIVLGTWNLKFRRPQLSDNGVYTCVVSNDYGLVKHNYSLQVLERINSPPVLLSGYPKPVTVRAGDNVELECIEKPNSQLSHYRWLKTDSPINASNTDIFENDDVNWFNPKQYRPFEIKHGETELNGMKLEVGRVTAKDTGYYSCFLFNAKGFTFGTAFLTVMPILPTDPPEFLIPKHERQHFTTSVEGEDVTFSCLVRGGAPLQYHWLFNGKLLKTDEEHEIRESHLLVRHSQIAHSGVYTCRIKNDYGHVEHNIELKVLRAKPLHPDHPVLLPGYPKDTTSVIGGSASLYCADTGDSLVDYRWLKWNSSVKSFTEADFLNGSLFTILHPVYHEQRDNDSGVYLTLTNLTMADQGLYTCLVSSIYTGFSYRSAFLTVKQPFKKHYDQQIHFAWREEESTSTVEAKPTAEISAASKASYRCFEYTQNVGKDELVEVNTKCDTTGSCASVFDEKKSEQKMFCDEQNLCGKHNITSGECAEVTFGRILCCCVGELCNQPTNQLLYLKTKKTQESSSKSHLTPVIFFSTLVLTVSLMLALLGYKMRQRKAALKESIVHKTRPNTRRMTKQKIMEIRWMKEDI